MIRLRKNRRFIQREGCDTTFRPRTRRRRPAPRVNVAGGVSEPRPAPPAPTTLSVGDCVAHPVFGPGVVVRVKHTNITVRFDAEGEKRVKASALGY